MWKAEKKNKKQWGIAWGIATALLVAVLFRVITERVFLAQASIEGAFATLEPDKSYGTVTMTGRYLPPPYGFSEEKLLRHFADKIGLRMEEEIRQVDYEDRKEYVYEKLAADAHSLIKLVHLPESEEYYLCGEIMLSGENATGVASFRAELKKVAEKMGLKEISTTMELCGVYGGEIPLGQKDAITDGLLRELYAQPVYENRENKNYTVYAYTGAEEEYLVVEQNKINVQVGIYYDRKGGCTEVVLASPLGLR